MLTTSFLACAAPRLVAPAMNDRMYADAATQANLATLRERGVEVIEPDEGKLASRGEHGRGRLPDPERLLARVEAALPAGERPWDGLRVLVTAGGTREPIDPVRFIGNRSSGRMGIALAAAAARRGAEVTLIAANVALPAPAGVRRIDVETAEQLAAAAGAEFAASPRPADGRRARRLPRRPRSPTASCKRQDGLDLRLEPTEDILAALAADRAPGPRRSSASPPSTGGTAVGRARAKLTRKGADLIVLNDVSDPTIGFESDRQRGHPDRPRRARPRVPRSPPKRSRRVDRATILRRRAGGPGRGRASSRRRPRPGRPPAGR